MKLKELLARGEVAPLFALSRLVKPVVVEMFALADFYRGLWIDGEHADVSTEQINAVSIAARAHGMDCFVRIPPVGYWRVTQCLEAGAGGVMAAMIHSADQASEFVSWCKFPPRGTRGLNNSGRDGDYSRKSQAQFIQDSNDESFVAIQIETLGALEQVDAIAALDGVDLLFVGPSDLSMALGVVGEFHSEQLWTAIEQVASACRAHGKAWGCVAPDPEFAKRALDLHCLMPTLGNDVIALRRGIDALSSSIDS